MKKKNALIIHFRSPMDYPPVYNLSRYLASNGVSVTLVAGKRKETSAKLLDYGVNLKEIDMERGSGLLNYLAYLLFYGKAFFELLRNQKTPIIYIESISSPPVFLYFFLFPFSKRKLAIHYHEYFDQEEHKRQSFLERMGRRLEPLLFRKARWISHTNKDRLSRFHVEFPAIENKKLSVMPNYPPADWLKKTSTQNVNMRPEKVRLVYVGSVSLNALYFEELVEWLISTDGNVVCDVYTKYMNERVLRLIQSQPAGVINFKGSLEYDALPEILPQYDVGLILYNGKSSSNFVYNAPNKLFEYLACGLDVWFSHDLLSSYEFETNNTYPKVVKVDFSNLKDFDYHAALSKKGMKIKKSIYVMESVYRNFCETILEDVQS